MATTTYAGSDGSEDRATSKPTPRLANCKDCLDAGYRRGFAAGEAAALENTPAGSSSVTTPLSYRRSAYVQAPTTQPRLVNAPTQRQSAASISATKKQSHYANKPPLTSAPRKLPAYVQRIQPKVQPTLPAVQPKIAKRIPINAKPALPPAQSKIVQRTVHNMHAGHGHKNKVEAIDCELTDALNRSNRPITRVISTKHHHATAAALTKPQQKPLRKPAPLKRIANIKHGDHYHYTDVDKADCALADALNRRGSIVRVVSK
ncbi:MAG: hypothetical protein ACPG47_03910 [Leucothrix sp.]